MRAVVLAVDPSADLHAAALCRSLQSRGDWTIEGLGGRHLQEAGVTLWEDLTRDSEMGVTSLAALWRWSRRIKSTRQRILDDPPDVVIGVDSPDFCLRVLDGLRGKTHVVQYVAPQAWAWRPGRREVIGRVCDQLLCIWPFEEDFFSGTGADVTWVGVPVLDHLQDDLAEQKIPELPEGRRVVCLMPGSRTKEVRLNLPNLIEAAWRLDKDHDDLVFLMPRAPGLHEGLFTATHPFGERLITVQGNSLAAMQASDLALAVNGTATIELMLMGVPHVATYAVPWLMGMVYRPLMRTEHFHMANILAGRTVVPEWVDQEATADRLVTSAQEILEGPAAQTQREAFDEIRERLGGSGAGLRAAQAVMAGVEKR